MKQELSLEEMRTRTLELLGSNDAKDLEYIDESYAYGDAEEFNIESLSETEDENGILCPQWHGHSMAYGSRNGQPTYEFMSTASCASIGGVCLGTGRYWNYQSQVNHFSTGYRCNQNNNNTAVLAFRRR
jgi:hypothetical protein